MGSTHLIRKMIISRPSRRNVSTSSSGRTSTSPQRHKPAAAPKHSVYEPRPFADIPGPMALPMLRHSAHVLPRIGNFHHTVGLGLLEGLRAKYGDLVRLAKGYRSRPVLYVFDPQIMREVYESNATEPPRWEKSPLVHQRTNTQKCPMQGDESRAIWAALRALLQDRALLTNYEAALDQIAEDATRRLGELRHSGNSLNEELETEVFRWAIESLGMVLLGTRLGCLDGTTHIEKDRSSENLTPAEQLVRSTREIIDGNYLVRSEGTLKTDSETFNSALKTFDKHFSLIEHFVTKALHELNIGILTPEKALLDILRPLNRRLLPVTADMMLAGVDPLAHTALTMFYQLSLNPAKQQRAHDEVRWAAASVDAGASNPDLPYIDGCGRETLRLSPTTGGVVRRSREEMVLDGYEIPVGVDIVLAHNITSKSEEEWGRANAFIPERWCNEGWQPLRASHAHPVSSMPFGEACPAEGIVGKMLSSLASKILDKYRLEWHGPQPSMVTTSVNKIQGPFYFVLQDAS